MFGWLRRKVRLHGDEDNRLVAFTVGILCLGTAIVGIDIAVTARTMQADELGYPVRLIIEESRAEAVLRPAPVLMGENVELISAALAERADEETLAGSSRKLRPGEFARAFGTSPRDTSTAKLASPHQTGANGMIDVNFDLEGGANSAKAISVDKPVAIGGATSGRLAIRIDGAAQIFADRGQVAALIDSSDAKTAEKVRTASGDDYLSFQKLRDLGVNIRYDPTADRIVIPTES